MIGGYAQMGRALLDHLQHGVEHPDDRAAGPVLTLSKTPQPVEMPEQLVGAVDEVYDHASSSHAAAGRRESHACGRLLRFARFTAGPAATG